MVYKTSGISGGTANRAAMVAAVPEVSFDAFWWTPLPGIGRKPGMSSELIPGFSSLGMRVPTDDIPLFERLLKSLWLSAIPHPSISGSCGVSSGDHYRVWMKIDGGIDQILDVPGEAGMIAKVESYQDHNLIRLWFGESENPGTEPLFPALVRSPQSWFSAAETAAADPLRFALTLLSREAGFFPDREAMNSNPDFANFASRAIIPTGLFVEEGGSPRPALYVIGEVLGCTKCRNEMTGDPFHVLRVRSLGGDLSVALPWEAVTADMTGWIIAVEGLATGVFPDLVPEPALEPGSSSSPLDSERIESEIRRLFLDYVRSENFKDYFGDIHVDGFTFFLCVIFGIFFKNARDMPRQRGRTTPKLAARYREAARKAPIVMARVVMANSMLLEEGKPSPALVVVAFGEGADRAMDAARKTLARIHFEEPADDNEKELARQIEDETYTFGKRRRLPEWLVGPVEAYATDLWVPKAASEGGEFHGEWLACVAEPGLKGLTAAIPFSLVTQAINRVSGPPPIPSAS